MSNEKLTMNFIRNDGIPFTNISFSNRPDKEILDYLKQNGWRYYSKKGEGTTGRWYPFTAEAKRGCDDFIKDFTEKFFPEQSSSLLAEDSANPESGSSSSQDSTSGTNGGEQISQPVSSDKTFHQEILTGDSADDLLLKIIEKSMDYELTPAAYERIANMLKDKIINESVEFARFTDVISQLQEDNRSLREENERLRQNLQSQENKQFSPAVPQDISTSSIDDEPTYLINGESYKKHEIESLIEEDIQNIFHDLVPEPYIGGISVYGNPDKDEHIKILVQYGTENYEGEWREDDLFNVIADEHLQINGIPVDVNPITPEKSGTIKEYLGRLERLGSQHEEQAVSAPAGKTQLKENSEVAEETAVIPEHVEQEKSGGNVETEPETSTVTDDTKTNEEKNIAEADELFTSVTTEFHEKNKKTLDDYEKLKEAYIENNSRYIGDARLRRLFEGGHSAIVTLRMQELESIIKQARTPEIAKLAAVHYLYQFGTDEFVEDQRDCVFLRCGLGHINHSPNGSHFVSPAADDISSFINQAYLFHKGEMEYLDDEAILDIVHKGGFEFRFDKEKEQLDIIKTNEDERTVGRVNYKPGYGFVISSYGYSESEVPYMIRNYANQFALVSPELSEIRQKQNLDDELARDFATLDSRPDVWLELLNKGADPRKAIKVAAADANLGDNLRWLIDHIPEDKLKEYFSDEEWADEVYETAKSSVTNDKESWQEISDIGIDVFMQIAELCGRGEYAEEYFHELIVESGFEKYYHNKYLNEFLALRYEDSSWSYVFYDRDFNEADGGTYTSNEARNLTDFDKAAENIIAEHYQLGSFDPDGKTQSELDERAGYEENLSYANWEPLDYKRFSNFKSSSFLYKDNCIDILQKYRDNTLTDSERKIIAAEESIVFDKPADSKEVRESIAAIESVMRSSKFYVQKKNPATGNFERKGQREVSVREARSLISPTDFATGIERSAYHITADRDIDDDTNLHFASNDATQMLPDYVISEEDMEVLREYLGTHVADHITEHFDEIFSEHTGAASPSSSHEEPAEKVEQEKTPETSDNTVQFDFVALADEICQTAYSNSDLGYNYNISFDDIAELAGKDVQWVKDNLDEIGKHLEEHNDELLLDFSLSDALIMQADGKDYLDLTFCSVGENGNILFKQDDNGRWIRKTEDELDKERDEINDSSEQEELVLTDKELETAKSFIPNSQYITTLQLAEREERDFFVRTLKNIASAVENAPKIRATDGMEQHPIVLRYFHPTGTESFVTEIGNDGEAFGFQCLNGDYAMAEWGYLDINEIKRIPMMQVDYHIPEGMTVERYLYQERPDFFPQYAKFAEQKHEQNNDVSEQEILVNLINDACKKDEELRQSASVNSRDLFEAAYFDKVSEILIAEWDKGNKSDLARKLLDGNDDYKKEILGNYIDEVYDYLNNKSPLDIAKETGNDVEAIAEALKESPDKTENRKYQVVTYDRDSGSDSKGDYTSLEEAVKEAKNYLTNDYYKDEDGKPYYEGVGVYNADSLKIEFTEGYFPINKIFEKYVIKQNFILDKLADAGIEVVTDKAEFDRILENETILQKMTKENKVEDLFISENDENLDSEIDKLTIKDINVKDDFIEISKETPFILRQCGLDNHPVYMYKQKLARALFLEKENFGERRTHGHKGEFTDKEVKEVFNNLGNPRYIFNSTKNNSIPNDFYLLGVYDQFDKNNNPMMVSFHFDKNTKEVEANWVTAVYGRNKIDIMKNWIDKGYLLYINDTEIKEASAEVGTLYMRVIHNTNAFNDKIIRKSDFVNNLNVLFYKQDNQVYGFAHNNKIYLNPEIMNSEVALHEYTHLWDNYIQRMNPELWQKGKEIFRNTSLWNEVKYDPNYADIAYNDDLLLSEVHAKICGKMADEILNRILERDGELTKNSIIDWDKEVFDYCKERFWLSEKTGKDFVDFISLPMKDLFSGKDILSHLNELDFGESVSSRNVATNSSVSGEKDFQLSDAVTDEIIYGESGLENNSFKYKGKTYVPFRSFRESSPLAKYNSVSDWTIIAQNLDWKEAAVNKDNPSDKGFKVDDFYAAAGGRDKCRADIFYCVDTGKFYLPTDGGLPCVDYENIRTNGYYGEFANFKMYDTYVKSVELYMRFQNVYEPQIREASYVLNYVEDKYNESGEIRDFESMRLQYRDYVDIQMHRLTDIIKNASSPEIATYAAKECLYSYGTSPDLFFTERFSDNLYLRCHLGDFEHRDGQRVFVDPDEQEIIDFITTTYNSLHGIENPAHTEETEPLEYSFAIKDDTEFGTGGFKPVINLTAEEAAKKYLELNDPDTGIALIIPGDFIFSDEWAADGISIAVIDNDGDINFQIFGDTFINGLKKPDERAKTYIAAYKELYQELINAGAKVKYPRFLFDKEKELFPIEPTAELSEESRPVIITADNIEKLGIKVGTIVKDNEDSYWRIAKVDDFMASMYRCDKDGNKLDVTGNTGRSSFGEGLKQLLADGVFTYTLVSPSNTVQKEAAPDFVSSHIHFTGLSKPETKEHDGSENLTRENKKPDVYLNHSFLQFPGINKWLYQENKNGFVILTALDYEPGVHTVPIKVSDGSNGWKESEAVVDYTKTPRWGMSKEDFLERNLEQYLTSETAAPEKKTNSKKDIKAIREQCREILKKKDSEITDEDKAILAQYEGGGGTGESDRSADAVLNEFYTPDKLIEKVWEIADAYRPGAKRVLEPSAGTGKFANNRPDNEFTMYEIDETSARINRILHPDANVIHGAFQSQFFDKNGIAKIKDYTMPQYDIVIGNPPYGTYKDSWHGKGEGKEFNRYEEYFLSRGIESLNIYGLNDVLVYVVPSGFLKSQVDSAKIKIASEGILIDAYRLPEGTFPTTEVGTDIVVFMRNKDKDTSQSLRLLGNDAWFEDHPEKILGQVKTRTNRFGKEESYVTPHDGLSVQDELDKISVLCAESVRARKEAIIDGYIKDNLEWLVNERQCSREDTADMLHLLYHKFEHSEAFERAKVIPLAFGDGQKQVIPEDNNLFTGSFDYSRKFKVGKQELIDVIGILDDTLDYHTVWDRAFAVQHGMEKKDVARLLTWNHAGNQWDLSESHHEFMDIAPEAEQEKSPDEPQELPEKTVQKSYAQIALESVKNGGAKNSVLDALLTGQVADNDYKNENALKLLRISSIDDWRSGFYRYDSDLKVIVNVRTLESVLYHSHYNHNRFIIAASDRDGFITPFFDENSPDFKKLTSNQKDKLRKSVEWYEKEINRIRDVFVGYEDGKFYLKDRNDRISKYSERPFFVPETNEIAMLNTENTLVAGLGFDYKDYKIWGSKKDIGDVVTGGYDDIKKNYNYTCGIYYASYDSLYPADGKYDIGRIIEENKQIEDSTQKERASYPLTDSLPYSKLEDNYKKQLASKKKAALALSGISGEEWFDKAIAYYDDKVKKHAEKLSVRNAEIRKTEDANVVLDCILSHKLTDRESFEAGSSYVLCLGTEKGTDVLINGKKALNIDSNNKSLVTYNNYYVTEQFVKALYDRFGGELSVSNVKFNEPARPVLSKLIKENLPAAPDEYLVNGITQFALDSTRIHIGGKPPKADFGGHTATLTQSGIISSVYLDGGKEPVIRFNRKSNLLTLYQSAFDSGAIESLENAFRNVYDKLHVTKYVTIDNVHYCDNDGFTVIMPEKASQTYHPEKTDIMSSDEFTKLYGTSWNEDERIFWEFTDYENYVDITKLTSEQSEKLRKSSNYYEEKDGRYIHRELFASGDIYQKIAANDEYFNKGQLSEESYHRNRDFLEKNVPVPYRFEEISVSVKSPFVRNLNIDGLPLPELFLQWATGCNLEDSRNSRFEINDFTQAGISREDIPPDIYWSDITDYIDGNPVKVDSAIKDEDKRKKIANEKANSRKVAAETLFSRFLREGLSKVGQDIFVTSYNRNFNYNKEPDYSRLPLFVYGMNRYKNGEPFTLYEQQIKGVAALSNKGNGLLAYEVGVGKTAAGVVSTVNQIQTGRSERPFIFVPKSVIKAWENDIRELFPDITLNVLGNMSYKNIAPYYDGNHGLNLQPGSITLCTHEALNNISFKRETVEEYLFGDFADLLALNDALDSTNPHERAEAEKKILDYAGCSSAANNDNYVFFENTGCDHVTVDEAHRFKNLYKVPRPKKGEKNEFQGMGSGTPSKRAAKMFAVTQYVQRENNDRNVFMLTATPFTNSPLEVYSMLSYIARKELEKQGIKDLYSFCEQYASTRLEQNVTHKNEIVYASVMKEFNDVQGLQNTLKKYIDKVDAEEALVIRPDRVVHPVYLQPTKLQQEIFEFAHNLMNYNPGEDEKRAPVLEGLNLINKASLSPALISEDQLTDPYTHLPSGIALPSADELVESSPKLKTVFDTVVKNWRSHKDCGQIVYSNIGTDEFSTMAKYLNKQGVPVSAIAIINGSDVIMGGKKVPGGSDEARDTVKDAFNDIHNPCKILIGSAAISEGMNLNGNSIALYNLTLGWNPTESVQVEGRIHRQGNAQGRVHIVYPLLEDSCDPFLYQKHDEKSSRIDDLFSYKSGSKMSVSGIDPQEAKFALIKNPATLADFEIQNKVNELEKQKLVYESQLQDYDSLVTARITFTERLNKRTEDKAAYEANFLKSGRTPDEQQRGIERLDKSLGDCKTNLVNIGKKLVAMGIENDADASQFSVSTNRKIDSLKEKIERLKSQEHKQEITEKWKMKLLEDNLLKSRRADTGNLAESISGDLVPFEVTEERVQKERWRIACENKERDPGKYEKAKSAWEKYCNKKAEKETSFGNASTGIPGEPENDYSLNKSEKNAAAAVPTSPKLIPPPRPEQKKVLSGGEQLSLF
ncbi:MAG: Eco57I restriction-modification methylase domain-containing protein [Treponemataceae bacterium]|nr:Eco57I restriction-modification methylase domain-containing protein [Treponemataceae bacterium]